MKRKCLSRREALFLLTAAALSGALAVLALRDAAPLAPPDGPGTAHTPGTLLSAARVDLNTAGLEALCTLPGIGPAKAAAILEYREQHGPFLEPDGLLEVPGIGETLFGDIADYICVDAQEEDP